MKAIVKTEKKTGALAIQDVPIPSLERNNVLIKVKKTAICGTDAHIYKWDEWAQKTIKPPMVIGHEFVGEIVRLGENVTGFEVGQLVSGEGHVVCGKCRHCITGSQHLCRQTASIGVNMQGIFSEYIAIPATNVWVCDPKIDEEILSILDPLGNAVHTALYFNVVGEDVLITGAGPIGLMSIAVVKRLGARSIVVTDKVPYRLKMAQDLGATTVLDVRTKKLSDALEMLNLREGFDVGLEISGSDAAFADMVEHMANGGRIAALGIPSSDVKINWDKVIFNSLTLKGIYGRHMYDTWYKMTALLQSGLDTEIKSIITHRFSYEDFQKGFDIMTSGDSGKVVLNWE